MKKKPHHQVENVTTDKPAETAEDVAAAVDEETVEAVEGDLKNGRRKHVEPDNVDDQALEDAIDAADMVAEGGPVAEPADEENND